MLWQKNEFKSWWLQIVLGFFISSYWWWRKSAPIICNNKNSFRTILPNYTYTSGQTACFIVSKSFILPNMLSKTTKSCFKIFRMSMLHHLRWKMPPILFKSKQTCFVLIKYDQWEHCFELMQNKQITIYLKKKYEQ